MLSPTVGMRQGNWWSRIWRRTKLTDETFTVLKNDSMSMVSLWKGVSSISKREEECEALGILSVAGPVEREFSLLQ